MNVTIDIQNCIDTLKSGGIICYPTDTVWGLGCDATNPEAVKKIFDIKQREENKSLIILVADENMLSRYVDILPNAAIDIITHVTSPTTIIYDKALGIASNAVAEDGSCAVRIATDSFCKELIKKFKKPIISTSANISGEKTPAYFAKIDKEITAKCNYVVQFMRGDKTINKPSSIIKISNNGMVKIIRK